MLGKRTFPEGLLEILDERRDGETIIARSWRDWKTGRIQESRSRKGKDGKVMPLKRK